MCLIREISKIVFVKWRHWNQFDREAKVPHGERDKWILLEWWSEGGGFQQRACLFSWISVALAPLAGVSRSERSLTAPTSTSPPPLCSLSQIFLPDGDAGEATWLSPAGVHDLISLWPTCQTLLQSSTQADVLKPAPNRAPFLALTFSQCSSVPLFPGLGELDGAAVRKWSRSSSGLWEHLLATVPMSTNGMCRSRWNASQICWMCHYTKYLQSWRVDQVENFFFLYCLIPARLWRQGMYLEDVCYNQTSWSSYLYSHIFKSTTAS